MRTYFQDFVRDNGLPITVEYGVGGSYSPTTYSPMYGADGGDFPEFVILKAWPRTLGHERIAKLANNLWSRRSPLERAAHATVCAVLRIDEWLRCRLTTAEHERMEAWLAENYVDEPDEDY